MPAELSRRRLVMKTAPTGYVVLMGELSGPIPEQVAKDLEQLKLRLFDMRADELPTYASGSDGPAEADALLARSGRAWRPVVDAAMPLR